VSGLGKRAFLLTFSKFANYGLMLISPVVLVRLLSVEDFGRYREFIVYSVVLQSFASFSINDSLLYFIPRHPANELRVIKQTIYLVCIASGATIAAFLALDMVFSGQLSGHHRTALAVYTLLFVNLDFWEALLLAQRRSMAMFAYTVGRLAVRVSTVVVAAMVTRNVEIIIWCLVVLEAIRFAASGILLLTGRAGAGAEHVAGLWADQLKFCVPAGIAVTLAMFNRNMGNLAVTKMLGVAALAHYTIGTYGEPIVVALRNSLSTLLLPEMVRRGGESGENCLAIWRQATVVNCLLLFPVAVLTIRFAAPLVLKVFGEAYRPAIPVLQVYAIIMIRECFDFSPPLRAINRNQPLVHGNVASAFANFVLLLGFVPAFGLVGAMAARVVSSLIEAVYLFVATCRSHGVVAVRLLPWRTIGRVGGTALLAAAPLVAPFWTTRLGFAGIFIGSGIYLLIFTASIYWLQIEEAQRILRKCKAFFYSRRQAPHG